MRRDWRGIPASVQEFILMRFEPGGGVSAWKS